MRKLYTLSILLLLSAAGFSQSYATWSKTELKLSNGLVERNIQLPVGAGKFVTTRYKPVKGSFGYFTANSPDFQFEFDGIRYSGMTDWLIEKVEKITDLKQGNGAMVTLLSADKKISVDVLYLLYPNSPTVRKNLKIKNLSGKTAMVESVDVEKFDLPTYTPLTYSWVCHDYGRRRSLGPYDGNMQDALVVVHNSDLKQGIVLGNEAPGVVKYTSFFWGEAAISVGLTHKDARFPFRKYLASGETFTTPQVFTMVYNNHKTPQEILNTDLPDFVRNFLGARLFELQHKPVFVYNTWVPFKTRINEALIIQLAKSAADAGMKEFIIDDGWEENFGDWIIDTKKFPRGLKPVFDYLKSLGMKPGLWVSVGSASPGSKVYKAHPEWFVLNKQRQPANLHIEDTSIVTACFGTGWYDYIKAILLKLSLDYGLEYLKLDFTVVTSPYRFNNTISGCYAKNHPGHRDRNESLFTNYVQVWKLFDELHTAKPDLFIDCTFETMGGLQLIDYAMIQHAEGDWLSNFYGQQENVDLRIRNMAWWRSPAMPATALVIGNPEMQDSAWDLHIKSLAGAIPIMLGDPRKLSSIDFKRYRAFADWLQLMENKYQVMSFRQDLSGFGEPMEGQWDGFQRINSQNQTGGIIGIFRHGAKEENRLVTIKLLHPERVYVVKKMSGEIVATASGTKLENEGFEVGLTKLYDGELFEIAMQ